MPVKKIRNQESEIRNKIKEVTQKSKVGDKKSAKAAKVVATEKVSASVKVASKKVVKGLTVDVYDTKGKVSGSLTLPKEIFGVNINKQLLAQSIRVYLANQRRGTSSTKTRGEVQGSTRKIYKQKGTGRARHGAIRAPIFVHGGIAFGPKPRDYSLSLPKKMKKIALFSALSVKHQEGAITVVSGFDKIAPKTKEMAGILQKLPLEGKNEHILFILSDNEKDNITNVYKAARNIKGVELLPAAQLNTYQVLKSNALILMQSAIDTMQKTFVKGV